MAKARESALTDEEREELEEELEDGLPEEVREKLVMLEVAAELSKRLWPEIKRILADNKDLVSELVVFLADWSEELSKVTEKHRKAAMERRAKELVHYFYALKKSGLSIELATQLVLIRASRPSQVAETLTKVSEQIAKINKKS